jgi:oligopeptide transport system substrate-binding protein
VEKFGEKWTQPANIVTNGAYKLKDWVVNERMVLERNPQYWDNAKTVINQVTYLPISSEVTDVNRYRSGEIDMTYNNMPIELFQKLKKRSRKKFTSTRTCAPITMKSTTRKHRSPTYVFVPR